MTAPLFGIVGWKNSGKTTLMSKLISRFASSGLNVAAIKHAHHAFDIDHQGRDSYRYREAGAATVVVASSVRYAVMRELKAEAEPTLADLITHVQSADLILVEGFKTETHAKLEVRRRESLNQTFLSSRDANIVAVAADYATDGGTLPVFDLNDVEKIATFVAINSGIKI